MRTMKTAATLGVLSVLSLIGPGGCPRELEEKEAEVDAQLEQQQRLIDQLLVQQQQQQQEEQAPEEIEEIEEVEPETLVARTFTLGQLQGGGTFEQFSPNAAGREVNVRISGDATGSRIVLFVFDGAGDIVVFEDTPVTNVTEASFTSTNTGDHSVLVFEVGDPSALYELSITQE